MENETEQIFVLNFAESQPSGSTQTPGVVEVPSSQPNLENVEDFSRVCRTCATITEFVIPIFGAEGQTNNLAPKINKHLPIQVSEDDVMPRVMCYQCASTLLAWHELVACCEQAEAALRARLASVQQEPTTTDLISDQKEADDSQSPFVSHDLEPCGDTDRYSNQSDDEPLATLATKPTHLYDNFYRALVNFRNHLVNDQHKEDYPDFTDSSKSGNEDNDVDRFDDLSQTNMRRDRLDEETRLELSEVQNKINDKVYYTCKICSKNLSSAHTYLFHKRIHTGERPCVCHICGKQFRAPNGLQRHLTETHERVRRYTCSLCPKNFANSQNLKQHLRIHTGEKPFECPHCEKRFTQSGSLHVHLKTHSEQFPHQCAECGAKFRLRSGLVRHKLKHTGERPHVCGQCGKGFRQRHELNSHSLLHSDAKPHSCALCGAAFRLRRALCHHFKRLHRHEPPPPPVTQLVYNHVGQY